VLIASPAPVDETADVPSSFTKLRPASAARTSIGFSSARSRSSLYFSWRKSALSSKLTFASESQQFPLLRHDQWLISAMLQSESRKNRQIFLRNASAARIEAPSNPSLNARLRA